MEPWVYVVLLGIAVMVFAILQQNRSAGKGVSVADFEEALDRFADVMEEDNRELLETVSGWRRELEAEIHRLEGRLDGLEKQLAKPVASGTPAGAETGAGVFSAEAGNPAPRSGVFPAAAAGGASPVREAHSSAEERRPQDARGGDPVAGPGERERGAADLADANEAIIPPVIERSPRQEPPLPATQKPDAPAKEERTPATGIRSRYRQLFEWYDAGKSVDYIAKKSGMNKGEVLLILQLAKREDQNRG